LASFNAEICDQIKNLGKLNFDPLSWICLFLDMYLQVQDSEQFCQSMVTDSRSYNADKMHLCLDLVREAAVENGKSYSGSSVDIYVEGHVSVLLS
jgi:hypothetical protein